MTLLEPRRGQSDELDDIATLATPLTSLAGLDPFLDRIETPARCPATVATEGYLFVMGRIDDVIRVAGRRLSTAAMEEFVCSHPDVAEAR